MTNLDIQIQLGGHYHEASTGFQDNELVDAGLIHAKSSVGNKAMLITLGGEHGNDVSDSCWNIPGTIEEIEL